MKKWPDNCIDLIVTDPPYQLTTASHYKSKLNPWADLCNSAFWFAELFRTYRRLVKSNGAIWQFLNWRSLPTIQKATFDAKTKIESLMVWDKIWIGPGGNKGLRPRYELVALIANKEFQIKNRGISDIYQCLWSGHKPHGHPSEKPVELCKYLIEISGNDKNIILDPFSGSGTSLVSATELKRQYIGIEIDPYYCRIARKRLRECKNNRQKSSSMPISL